MMSVMSMFKACVRLCNCWSSAVLRPRRVRLTLSLLLPILRKVKVRAGLLTLLSTLSKNVLRLVLSRFNCVRVIQP